MSIVEVHHLTHRFRNGAVGVRDVSWRVAEGELVVIAGANGSGKSTLLKHLNGLLLPTSGEVRIAGLTVGRHLREVRRLVGMVFQDADSQIVGETVYDDVAFGPENLSVPRRDIPGLVAAALRNVGLSHMPEQRPHLLSGGEKRRLAIAGVLAMDPRVVVMDEPFSNLDYPGTRQVLEQIFRLRARGCTVLVSTHDLEKIISEADRLVVMQQGQMVLEGPPEACLGRVEEFGVRAPCAFRLGMETGSWLN